jgi:hypothetical protein
VTNETSTSAKKRKQLQIKMATVFENCIAPFSSEYRQILVDDLVSAFESRMHALSQAQSNLTFLEVTTEDVQVEAQ